MVLYRGLHKSKTFPEKVDKLEVANSASCKLLQVTDDATFYAPVSLSSDLAVTGQATITGKATVSGIFTGSATTDLNGAFMANVRTSTAVLDTTTYNDCVILMQPGYAMATLTLATEEVGTGRMFIIKDISGFSATATSQIRIAPESGVLLDNSASAATIKVAFGSKIIFSDAASFWTVADYQVA